ncbi:MAG: hypothetical protein WCZ23_10700 [Rhodospirillaceae bacterium]
MIIDCTDLTYTPAWLLRAAEISWGNSARDMRRAHQPGISPGKAGEAAHHAANAAKRAAAAFAASPDPWTSFNRVQAARPARDKGGLAEYMIRTQLRHNLLTSRSNTLDRYVAEITLAIEHDNPELAQAWARAAFDYLPASEIAKIPELPDSNTKDFLTPHAQANAQAA